MLEVNKITPSVTDIYDPYGNIIDQKINIMLKKLFEKIAFLAKDVVQYIILYVPTGLVI